MKIFDSHFHIIDPKYPLFENNGFLPESFTIQDYQDRVNKINIVGGAIVSGSFQKFDQEYLVNSLKLLGNNFYGVANIPIDISSKEIKRLNSSNIVAIRINLKRGDSTRLKELIKLSNSLLDKYNWHTELYVDSKNLKQLNSTLKNIHKFSIDHLGLSKEGLSSLYFWVEKGVKVKATGFGRLNFNPLPVLSKIYNINPKALMFGTDLPSTRAKYPFSFKDIKIIRDNFTVSEQENIFYKNSIEWYNK
ncbi:amidohydrolase family protein [Tenacibaculum sp. 190524A02b]|uniref:amidohydrolase family protein n=1 Tax=Tenacibaculum vairaonense TaxID=3137860 RepID=UPI0031FB1F20